MSPKSPLWILLGTTVLGAVCLLWGIPLARGEQSLPITPTPAPMIDSDAGSPVPDEGRVLDDKVIASFLIPRGHLQAQAAGLADGGCHDDEEGPVGLGERFLTLPLEGISHREVAANASRYIQAVFDHRYPSGYPCRAHSPENLSPFPFTWRGLPNGLDGYVVASDGDHSYYGCEEQDHLGDGYSSEIVKLLHPRWNLTKGWLWYDGHNGHDYDDDAARGVEHAIAAASGYVEYAGALGGYGNTVIIDHWNGYRTQYSHLESIEPVLLWDYTRYATVERGDRIGRIGTTGFSTGTHLHFAVYRLHHHDCVGEDIWYPTDPYGYMRDYIDPLITNGPSDDGQEMSSWLWQDLAPDEYAVPVFGGSGDRGGPVFFATLTSSPGSVSVQPGQSFQVSLAFRNDGLGDWSPGTGIWASMAATRLVNTNGTSWGTAPDVAIGQPVPIGNSYTWDLSLVAPSVPGDYNCSWVVQIGSCTISDPVNVSVAVRSDPPPLPPPSDNVEVLSIYPAGHNYSPGEQFQPRVRIRVSGFTLSEARGDHLHNRDDQVYGSWPVQAVRGENLTEYEFVIDPMTAPSSEGTYYSKWQLRVGGEYRGPEITLSFNVQNPPPDPRVDAWRIQYFSDDHLGSQCAEAWENSPYIFKDWEYGAPASGCNSNHWSARFTKQAYFEGGNYSFHVQHDDGIRLYIDGQLVRGLDCWWTGDGGHNSEGNFYLSTGTHEVKLEYFDENDHARVELYWYGPGALPKNHCDSKQWCAQYRGNERLWGPIAFLQNEGAYFLSKDWGANGPGYGLPSDQFSSRFERTLYFPSGRWRFYIFSDDGFRFSIDDSLVLDEWHDQRASHTVDVDLDAGEHFLRAEHFEKSGWAAFSLSWENITPPDTIAPTVSWTAPVGGGDIYHVAADEVVQLGVEASDNVAVDRIEWTRWDAVNQRTVQLGSSDTAPYRLDIDTSTLNWEWNEINAYAYDTAGNKSVGEYIWIYRSPPDISSPEVFWVSPVRNSEGIELSEATVRLEVSVADDRTVSSVSLQSYDASNDSWTTLATFEGPPYVLDVDCSSLGPAATSYEIRALAWDEAGNVGSASIFVRRVEPLPDLPDYGPADSPWPMVGHDLRHSGRSPYNGPEVPTTVWAFVKGASCCNLSAVIGSDGLIYVGGAEGSLYALDAQGRVRWQFSQADDYVGVTPAIAANGTLYFGSRAGTLYALKPDGTAKWSYHMGGWSTSPIVSSGGTVYVGSGEDCRLYALNPDGTAQWRFSAASWINSPPAVGYDGTIYVGSSDSRVYALTPYGTCRWSYQTGGYVDASPVTGRDGTIYVGSWDSKLHAINPDGSRKWVFTTDGAVGSPAIGEDEAIYFGSMDSYVYALWPDGTLRWRYPTGDSAHQQPAIGADGTIYAVSNDGVLRAFNTDGSLKWQHNLGGWLNPPIIGVGNRIYVTNYDALFCVGEEELPRSLYVPLILK
jgi:outer membrane protein assembly factor BamB/murein DD-endopeptidase MepM/ murein hydrolase activator NlpD